MRPKIVISSCLIGENVRYDGKPVYCPFVEKLSKYVDFIPVCPEISIGLPVPRDPIVVVRKNGKMKVVNPKTGEDLTERLLRFSKNFLSQLKDIDGFLLKSKSPSCGVSGTKTYKNEDGTGFLYRNKGLFAKKVMEIFPYLPVEDELRLKNWDRRFFFLLKIFLSFRLRNVETEKELYLFHNSYSQVLKIINTSGLKKAETNLKEGDIKEYKKSFLKALKKPSPKIVLKRINKAQKNNYKSLKEAVLSTDIFRNMFPEELL
ncbi:MAG: DUF523 domain-containing protein [Aquificota bacterium]|nr:MAG: DUF523 domain-containing protein [Aquificota bacterium]